MPETLAERIAEKWFPDRHGIAYANEEKARKVCVAAIQDFAREAAAQIRAEIYAVDSLQWEQALNRAAAIVERAAGR